MSESKNVDADTISFREIYEIETRNLAGCDNDDSCCTFPKGYVSRQALFHCITCKNTTGKQGGICYPCSIHCHSGHILNDLYTKRNFRCDCGNSNFPPDFSCNLWEDKDDINMKNKYNHNFSGLYCICNLEYDEEKDNEEMDQCIICEDWYHLKHLANCESEIESINSESYEEFICKLCLESRGYLQIYNRANLNNILRKYVVGSDSLCNLAATTYALSTLQSPISAFTCGAFLMSEWKQNLCRCDSCVQMMETDGTLFLLNSKDSIGNYYDNSKVDNEFDEELSNLPFSHAIQLAEGIATFKQEFSDFISSMDPDKVITVDDIHNFSDKIKRRRLERQE